MDFRFELDSYGLELDSYGFELDSYGFELDFYGSESFSYFDDLLNCFMTLQVLGASEHLNFLFSPKEKRGYWCQDP